MSSIDDSASAAVVASAAASVAAGAVGNFGLYYLALSSAASILAAYYSLTAGSRREIAKYTDINETTYDYIIVGAGTAGSVLANRLTEDPQKRVLVLEAGPEPIRPISEIPLISSIQMGSDLDWRYTTVPQKRVYSGQLDNKFFYFQGKTLGGASTINQMVYTRGNRRDYDKWREMGHEGWGFDDVLPYFKKLEDQRHINNDAYYGRGGPISLENNSCPFGFCQLLMETADELGIRNYDQNGARQEGLAINQFNTRNGFRSGAYSQYLLPVSRRPNIRIETFAQVEKIIFCGDNSLLACGVVFWIFDQRLVAYATKEVILSAGSIGTPKILLLSGIGPKEQLQKHNIDQRAEMPVGRGLRDHISVRVEPFLIDQRYILQSRDPTSMAAQFIQFINEGTGLYSTPLGVEGIGFFASSFVKEKDWPDTELVFLVVNPDGEEYVRDVTNVNRTAVENQAPNDFTIAVSAALLRPESLGTVELASSNFRDSPLLDHNYLDVERDWDILIEGIQRAHKIMESKSMKRRGVVFSDVPIKACAHLEFRSDSYWKCYIQHKALPFAHATGTCRMGSVVDSQLRLIGFPNIRIVDNSVIPVAMSGHTHAVALMIGEKGSDLIKRGQH